MSKTRRAKSQYKPKNYFALPHYILDHPDYFNMNLAAQALLNRMGRLYNGFNNGDIAIPFSVLRDFGWRSSGTLNRAKEELLAFEWIRLTRMGNKYGLCHLYGLTWIPLDEDKKLDLKPSEFALRDSKKVIGTW